MTEKTTKELSAYEERLAEALRKKADSKCPFCGHRSYYFLEQATGPWLVLCCQKCGFKLEYLIDILMEGIGEEGNDVS